jgi:hypothetical protein
MKIKTKETPRLPYKYLNEEEYNKLCSKLAKEYIQKLITNQEKNVYLYEPRK